MQTEKYEMCATGAASTCILTPLCFLLPAVPDYRALYAKLDKLRLDAGHMWATWLNDQYLQLVQDAGSPADSNMLMRLNSVWWLDVGGSIAGEKHCCLLVKWQEVVGILLAAA